MADENALTDTVPVSTDTTPVVPAAEAAPPSGESKPDAEKAQEQPSEKPKVDPLKAELSYLKRKIARQERERTALLERVLTAKQEVRQPVQEQAAPKLSDFNTVEEFLEVWDKYKETKRSSTAKESVPDQGDSRYMEAVKAARDDMFAVGSEKYEDFEDLVSSDDVKITVPMRDAIFDIDDLETQAEVAYYLAQNPKESIRISRLSPVRQAKEVDRLEQKLTAKPTPVKRASAAPAPIEPVGGAKTSTDDVKPGMKFEDFLKVRNKQLGRNK